MPRTKPSAPDMVWRISDLVPQGEWVPKGSPVRREAPGVMSDGWTSSSFDLLRGAEAVDVSDSMSGELFDELFRDK